LVAQRPYNLRHAAVSTWLNATGNPAQVAEWAGHSVNVLMQVYAKCLSGRQEAAKRRIYDATRPLTHSTSVNSDQPSSADRAAP
jgi:integrase